MNYPDPQSLNQGQRLVGSDYFAIREQMIRDAEAKKRAKAAQG